jgi:hypothetical protein
MLTFSFSMAFATGSPTKGNATTSGGKYATTKAGTATYTGPVKKTKKTATVAATVTKNGYTYKVVSIKAYAFKGSKAKTITIKSKKLKSISKKAFNGSKVKKSKIVVKVPKSKYKAYKKMLVKAGIKAKNIKKY